MASTIFPKSHVGFDSITSQIERKLLKRGFQFNVICVGESQTRRAAMPTNLPNAYRRWGLAYLLTLSAPQVKPVSASPP